MPAGPPYNICHLHSATRGERTGTVGDRTSIDVSLLTRGKLASLCFRLHDRTPPSMLWGLRPNGVSLEVMRRRSKSNTRYQRELTAGVMISSKSSLVG